MNEPIKQHYVPQKYLERFCTTKKNSKQIYALHKNQNRIINTNVRDAGVERHFYTLESSEDKYLWEKNYSTEVEPILSNIISKIYSQTCNVLVQNYSSILDYQMKKQLSCSIIYQLFRGKHSREFQENVYLREAPKIVDKLHKTVLHIDESKEKVIEQFLDGKKFFKEVSFETTYDHTIMERYTDLLLNKCFVIYRIIGNGEFITSDNPVMFINSKTLDVKPFSNGILDSRTIIFFPIDTKLLVALYDSDYLVGEVRNYDGRLLFINSKMDMKFIKNINSKQYEQSYNQVYAKSKNILEQFL